MKVDQILIVGSLLSPKIIISSRSVELKRSMAQNTAAPPIYTSAPLKFLKFVYFYGQNNILNDLE
jgi:hypothetical protein